MVTVEDGDQIELGRQTFRVQVRELEAAGIIKTVVYTPTEDNPADVLTKYLPYDVYLRHTNKLLGHPSENEQHYGALFANMLMLHGGAAPAAMPPR